MANEDININAGLSKTTSEGPGRLQLDPLEIAEYMPADLDPRNRSWRQRNRKRNRKRRSTTGLGNNFAPGSQGASLSSSVPSSASSQSVQAPQTTKEKKYVRLLNIPGAIGGYVKAEWDEPGAIYAGERDVPSGSSQSRNVRVGSIGGASPASLSNSSIAPQANSAPTWGQLSASQRAQIEGLDPETKAKVMAKLQSNLAAQSG